MSESFYQPIRLNTLLHLESKEFVDLRYSAVNSDIRLELFSRGAKFDQLIGQYFV